MATDMSHHAEAVSKINGTVSEFDISDGKNVEKLTEGQNESEVSGSLGYAVLFTDSSCHIQP